MNREQMKVKAIKAKYPKGTKVRLESMRGEKQMPNGLEGVVDFVDDIGQIHCKWKNGSSLALLEGVDDFRVIHRENTLQVLKIEPHKPPERVLLKNELKSLQEAVGGLIEVYELEDGVDLILNEEGKLFKLEPNRRWGKEIFVGTIYVVGADNNSGEFVSLTEGQMKKYEQQFAQPEEISWDEVENSIQAAIISW